MLLVQQKAFDLTYVLLAGSKLNTYTVLNVTLNLNPDPGLTGNIYSARPIATSLSDSVVPEV